MLFCTEFCTYSKDMSLLIVKVIYNKRIYIFLLTIVIYTYIYIYIYIYIYTGLGQIKLLTK